MLGLKVHVKGKADIERNDGRFWQFVAYAGRRPGCGRRVRWDQLSWIEGERFEEVLRYRTSRRRWRDPLYRRI